MVYEELFTDLLRAARIVLHVRAEKCERMGSVPSVPAFQVEGAAAYFSRLRFRADSFWYTKSNAFTLLLTLCEFSDQLEALDHAALKRGLASFSDNPPEDYALAAKEGVNNKKERTLRAGYVRGIANSAGGNTQAPN
jgi:hypothetical protein